MTGDPRDPFEFEDDPLDGVEDLDLSSFSDDPLDAYRTPPAAEPSGPAFEIPGAEIPTPPPVHPPPANTPGTPFPPPSPEPNPPLTPSYLPPQPASPAPPPGPVPHGSPGMPPPAGMPAGAYQAGYPPPVAEKKGRGCLFWGVIIVLVLGLLTGGCIAAGVIASRSASDAPDKFLDSIVAGDYDTAATHTSPACNITAAKIEEDLAGMTSAAFVITIGPVSSAAVEFDNEVFTIAMELRDGLVCTYELSAA